MALLLDGDIIECRVLCTQANQIGLNVLHAEVTNVVGTGVTEAQVSLALASNLAVEYKAILANTAVFRGVGTKKIFPLPAGIEFASIASLGAGTAGAEPLPKQICGLVSLVGSVSGRHGRGRLYIPFPAEADNTASGVPAAGYVTVLNTIGTTMATVLPVGTMGNTSDIVFGIWDRLSNTITHVTQGRGKTVWGTQRRRGDYGASNVAPF